MFTNFVLNLAAGLTQTLFEVSAAELVKAIVDPQRDALRAAFKRTFNAVLANHAHVMQWEIGYECTRGRTNECS